MTILLRFATAGLVLSGLAWADRPADRQRNQQRRISQGVQSGELTRKEAAALKAREASLHRKVVKDREDGPGLTPSERIAIEKRQDNISKDIAKEKHDGQKRP